jgi:predicted DNA-binding protein (UPF0251 family)
MPRPFKTRCIANVPGITVFKPAGIPARELTKVKIHFDELEAIRLVDGEGLDQAQAAERMKVSRPTVGRILGRVRKKIARALVEGEALFIEQGDAPVQHFAPHSERRRRGRPSTGKSPQRGRRTNAHEAETVKST